MTKTYDEKAARVLPPEPRNRRQGRAFVSVAAAIVIAAAFLGGVLWWPSDVADRSTGTAPAASVDARTWQEQLEAVFLPAVEGLPPVLDGLAEWRDGTRPGPDLAPDVDAAVSAFAPLAGRLSALPPAPSAPAARDRYAASARLYLEFLRVERIALDLSPSPLRDQLDLLARRVLLLADRVFDRGRVAVDATALAQPEAGELRFPQEVPDWTAEGLAAGPPMAAQPPSPPAVRPVRVGDRPEQDEASWQADVARAGVPAAASVAAAINGRKADELRALAEELASVAGNLYKRPDPKGGRERATVVALGLLVHGEAVRAAQAAVLLGGGAGARLEAVARRLAVIGDGLWDAALPARVTGFDPAVLEDGTAD